MSASPHPRRGRQTPAERVQLELDAIYATAPVGLCLLDTESRFLRINRQFADLIGSSAEQLVGEKVSDVFPDYEDMAEELVREVVERGEPLLGIERETPALHGMARWWRINLWPLKDSRGQTVAINIVLEEITGQKAAMNALQKSEERFRALIEHAPDIMVLLDRAGTIAFASPSVSEIGGYNPRDLIGANVRDLVHPDDMHLMLASLNASLGSAGKLIKLDLRVRDAAGAWHILEITGRNLLDVESVGGIVINARDITENRRADEALRESEEVFRALAETSAAAILVYQGERLVYANPVMERLSGYRMEELVGMEFLELIHPEDRPMIRECAAARQRGEDVPYRYEARYQAKDGRFGHLELNAALTNYKGRPAGLVTALDITERKQAEQALRQSQKRYQDLIETNVDFVWEVDAGGRYTYCSPQMEILWGIRPEEMIGRTPFDLMPPDTRKRACQEFMSALSVPARFSGLETCAIVGCDRRIFVETSGVPFFDESGTLLGYRGVTRDITERKRADEELQRLYQELEQRVEERTAELAAANRELESFTYSISHDLRAPLRAIDGFSDILLVEHASALTPEACQLLEKVRGNIQSMSQLIDDLLRFSRTGRQSLARVTVRPRDLVMHVLDGLKDEQAGRSIDMLVGDLPSCQADPTMLQQVFHNLLSNALKFTRTCEQAQIEVGSLEEDGHVVYYVRDNGIGIDLDYARKIFGVFQRFHPQEEYEGTGVGLAIVKRIVERHGGSIWVESEVGRGSTFFFTVQSIA